MLNQVTRPAAQQLLQLRLDGKIHSVQHALAVANAFQPADGFDFDDFIALTTFIGELDPCTAAPAAQRVASKYDLQLLC